MYHFNLCLRHQTFTLIVCFNIYIHNLAIKRIFRIFIF